MNKYLEEVQNGMDLLAADPRSIFVGQATKYKGHAISSQLTKYPDDKKIEFPVAEDMQAGFSLGLALEGYIPVCIYPRFDFAILACNQIFNHIDRWSLLCQNSQPKIIIKINVGSKVPLDGGLQHTANYVDAFRSMSQTIRIFDLKEPKQIYFAYEDALNCIGSSILIEYPQFYNKEV